VRFLTADESRHWAKTHEIELGSGGVPEREPAGLKTLRFGFPPTPPQLNWLAQFVAFSLKPRHSCLLWITASGIFPSSENTHLYYRLRQSYGDLRLLDEAPGHLFLEYEDADLATFLEVGILNGWDVHVLPELAYGGPDMARAFVCHDEWLALFHRDPETIAEWRQHLEKAQYRLFG
jgi:hypothetical protein